MWRRKSRVAVGASQAGSIVGESSQSADVKLRNGDRSSVNALLSKNGRWVSCDYVTD